MPRWQVQHRDWVLDICRLCFMRGWNVLEYPGVWKLGLMYPLLSRNLFYKCWSHCIVVLSALSEWQVPNSHGCQHSICLPGLPHGDISNWYRHNIVRAVLSLHCWHLFHCEWRYIELYLHLLPGWWVQYCAGSSPVHRLYCLCPGHLLDPSRITQCFLLLSLHCWHIFLPCRSVQFRYLHFMPGWILFDPSRGHGGQYVPVVLNCYVCQPVRKYRMHQLFRRQFQRKHGQLRLQRVFRWRLLVLWDE